jgi:hypothetical protein
MERTYKTEFPEFNAAELPPIPATWEDVSWKNDTCPSWATPNGFRVYVERLEPKDREDEAYTRFSLQHDERGHYTDTDNWLEITSTILAHAFSALVRQSFTAAQLDEINRRNALPEYVNACATQDFSDANMIMAEAFESIAGHEVDGNSDDDTDLWNAAWDKAREAHFSV